jgi:CCR4-NOT transcription complex subunit 1 TTP binding domain
VAEAARSPPGSKLSKFALEALAQFRDELASWPDFCATLLQVHLSACRRPAVQWVSCCFRVPCVCLQWPSVTTVVLLASSLPHAHSNVKFNLTITIAGRFQGCT